MSAADFYTGIVVDVYTVVRGTTFDATRYLEFVRESGEPALELGCGDDGPFLELIRHGLDVEGVDSSQDMLDRCRAKAESEGLRAVTYCRPMQDLDLPRRYRSVYLAGPTFNLLPDDETAARTLEAIARHLQPDGRALVPLWIPPATAADNIGRTLESTTEDSAIARYTVESEDYDEPARTRTTHARYELVTDGHTEQLRRDWIIHWHTPEGFAALAREAGLGVTGMTPVVDGEFTAVLHRN